MLPGPAWQLAGSDLPWDGGCCSGAAARTALMALLFLDVKQNIGNNKSRCGSGYLLLIIADYFLLMPSAHMKSIFLVACKNSTSVLTSHTQNEFLGKFNVCETAIPN